MGTDPYATLLATVLDPVRFPALTAAFGGAAFESMGDAEADRDAMFGYGLARILDGVERLITQRGIERDGRR